MFNFTSQRFVVLMMFVSIGILVSCGGDNEEPPPVETHTIGGTATGLTSSIVVRLNVDGESFEDLTIDSDGAFTFTDEVDDGSTYEVVPIDITPGCPTIHLINASGTANANVTTIEIEC
jgi:hypothetical protein